MPTKFENYRFKDGKTPLNADTFNGILTDVDLRIADLEAVKASWEDAVAELTAQGVERINEAIGPAVTELQDTIDNIVALANAVEVDRILDAADQVTDIHIGTRTADDSQTPTGNVADLATIFSWLANRIKSVTGAVDWITAPVTTLVAISTTLASHAAQLASAASHESDSSNPHAATAVQVGALPLSGGSLSGSLSLTGNPLSGVTTVGFSVEFSNGNSGAAKTISLSNGQKQIIILDADTTLTISTTSAPVGNYLIRLKQDATGNRAVTWSGLSATRWLGSAGIPAINLDPNGETILSIYFDGASIIQSIARVGTP